MRHSKYVLSSSGPVRRSKFSPLSWWPNGNSDTKPEVDPMTVNLFGATSC